MSEFYWLTKTGPAQYNLTNPLVSAQDLGAGNEKAWIQHLTRKVTSTIILCKMIVQE
jgi:hypothetical protein